MKGLRSFQVKIVGRQCVLNVHPMFLAWFHHVKVEGMLLLPFANAWIERWRTR